MRMRCPVKIFFKRIERTVLRESKRVENEDMNAERQLLEESRSHMGGR